jgi:hypothetical protein
MLVDMHNHPFPLRVSAVAVELEYMGELISHLPSHQRPTLKWLKQGMPSYTSRNRFHTSSIDPLAKALAQSKGMSIPQMLGPNANTAHFKRHRFKFVCNDTLLSSGWEGEWNSMRAIDVLYM